MTNRLSLEYEVAKEELEDIDNQIGGAVETISTVLNILNQVKGSDLRIESKMTYPDAQTISALLQRRISVLDRMKELKDEYREEQA